MKTRKSIRHLTGIIASTLLLTLMLMPSTALAATAAGTVISNTASVSWSGMSGAAPTATATVVVLPVAAAPALAYVSTAPGTSVGAASDVDITYTITSQSNSVDDYDLTLASVDTELTAPTFAGANPTAANTLGASMVIVDAVATNTIIIAGLLADHGIDNGDTVIIGGILYTVTTSTDNATDTTLVLGAVVTAAPGVGVFEQQSLVFTMTTGTFTSAIDPATHALTLTAASAATPAETTSLSQPTITVLRATLTITKTANPVTAAPGDTVVYTITVTNASGSSAANVTVTDATPTYTTYTPASGSYTIDAGGPVPFADGALGGAGVNVGNLADGSVAVVTFSVTID